MTFAAVYAWSENFVLPISHDEVVHGKRSLVAKVPGDCWQRRATVRALLAFMWALPRQAAALHGLRAGRRAGVERGARAGLGRCSHDPAHAGVQPAACATSTRPTGAHPALWSQDTTPDGFRWTRRRRRRPQRVRVRAHRRRRSSQWSAWRTSPPSRKRATGSACRGPVSGRRSSTPTPACTAVRGRQPRGGPRHPGPCHGQPASATLRIPPLGALWLRPPTPA